MKTFHFSPQGPPGQHGPRGPQGPIGGEVKCSMAFLYIYVISVQFVETINAPVWSNLFVNDNQHYQQYPVL